MMIPNRNHLPLGVDVNTNDVSLVAIEMRAGNLVVRAAQTRNLPACEATDRDGVIVETLRTLRRDLTVSERRCAIAAPLGETLTRVFRPPPGMRAAEAERAALLEADSFVTWPAEERLIALDPIPGDSALLLSVARCAAVERAARLVKLAGFDPVAVDVPACVWRRSAPEADAVLDLRNDRAALFVFGTPLGTVERFPRESDEGLIARTRAALIQARRDGLADVERIVTAGSQERAASIEAALRADGYDAKPLVLGEAASPSWAFAYGLATWAIVARDRRAA